MPSESAEYIKRVLMSVFRKMKRAPRFIFVDDARKWRILFKTCVAEAFGEEAGVRVLIGQDVKHCKDLLLASNGIPRQTQIFKCSSRLYRLWNRCANC